MIAASVLPRRRQRRGPPWLPSLGVRSRIGDWPGYSGGAASWGMDMKMGWMVWGPGRRSAVLQRCTAYQPGVEPRVCQEATDAF